MGGEDWPRPGGAQQKPHLLSARQLNQDCCKVAGLPLGGILRRVDTSVQE